MKRREAIKHASLIMGGAFVSSSLIWQGCKTSGSTSTYTPQLFTEAQMKTLTAMVDVILPKSDDSPSASEVGVPAYIDNMLFGFGDPEDNGQALAALDNFDSMCQSDMGSKYEKLSDEDKVAMMTKLAESSKSDEYPLFDRLRGMAVRGYFTSEEVGENVLNYKPVPSEQAGCVDISEIPNGRLWSFG